jgi:hypothetical protein
MCGRPLGCKSFDKNSDGRVECEHVSGLLTRHAVRWPRWGPRSSPKQFRGFEGRHANRVLWIIGSTVRHLIQLSHPGINARFHRRPATAGPRHARHRDPCRMGHPVAQSRPKPRGGSTAWSSERSSSIIARKASASALSCWFSGNASSQLAYSACSSTAAAMVSFHRGSGSAGRRGGVCGQPVRQPRARRDSVPDARRRSLALHRPMDGTWSHSQSLRDV